MLGILSAFLASVTWAFAVGVYADLSKKYPPSVVNFSRALVSAPLFLLVVVSKGAMQGAVYGALEGLQPMHFVWFGLSAIASYSLGDVLFMKSTQSPLRAAGALAIASIYPIWAALFGWMFLKQPLEWLAILGLLVVVLGTIGVILTSRNTQQEASALHHKMTLVAGVSLALVSSLLWSLNSFSIGHVKDVSPFLGNIIRMSFAMILCPLVGVIFLKSKRVFLDKEDFKRYWPLLLGEAFGGSLFYVYGVSHTSLALGAILTSLAPAIAVPLAYVRHSEVPSIKRASSVVAVLLGLWLVIYFTK